MNEEKINHPFHIPEGFFENFWNEMNAKMEQDSQSKNVKDLVLTISKYAAIFIFAFILGRGSVSYFQQKSQPEQSEQIYSVENVLSQVSDDDITNYLIENATEDVFN